MTTTGDIYYLRGDDKKAEDFFLQVEDSLRFEYFNCAGCLLINIIDIIVYLMLRVRHYPN